jgi:hypothetical protein
MLTGPTKEKGAAFILPFSSTVVTKATILGDKSLYAFSMGTFIQSPE